MNPVYELAASFHALHLGNSQEEKPSVPTPSSNTPPKSDIEDISDESAALSLCKKMQEDALLGKHFTVTDKTKFTVPKATEECKGKQESYLATKLVFPFKYPKKDDSYDITLGLKEELLGLKEEREAFFPKVKSIYSPGSWAIFALGPEWFSTFMKSAGDTYAPLIDQALNHEIADAADDIDTHFSAELTEAQAAEYAAKNIPPEQVRIENRIICQLIQKHHEQVMFQIQYTNGKSVFSDGFFNLLLQLTCPENRIDIFSIHVASSPISWLKDRKMTDEDVLTFCENIDNSGFAQAAIENDPKLSSIVMELACRHLFFRSYEGMYTFVREKSPFIHFHKPKEEKIKNNDDIKNDWFRIATYDSKENVHDILIMLHTDPKSPKELVSYQRIRLKLLEKIDGKPTVIIEADEQALLDQFCRWIRWINLANADQTDWQLYWMLVAKRYVSVIPGQQEVLREKFLSFCRQRQRYAHSFVALIANQLDKRNHKCPNLNFAFILGALSDLPEKEFPDSEIAQMWPKLERHFSLPNMALDDSWKVIAEPLIASKASYRAIMGILKLLALRFLATPEEFRTVILFKVVLSDREEKKVMQLIIGKRSLLLDFDPVTPSKSDLILLEEMAAKFGFPASYEINPKSAIHRKLSELPLKERALDLLKLSSLEGFRLLLLAHSLQPSPESLFTLLMHLPSFFSLETNNEERQKMVVFVQQECARHFPTLPTKFERRFGSHLQALSDQRATSTVSAHLSHMKCISQFPHPLANKMALEIWGSIAKKLTVEEVTHNLEAMESMPLASAINWARALKDCPAATIDHHLKCLERLSSRAFQEKNPLQEILYLGYIYELLRECIKLFPENASRLEASMYELLNRLLQQDKVDAAMQVAYLGSDRNCPDPIAMAARFFRQQHINPKETSFSAQTVFEALVERAPGVVSGDALYSRLFIEIASVVKRAEVVEPACRKFIWAARQPEAAAARLQECINASLAVDFAALWLDFCKERLANLSPAQLFTAWTVGKAVGMSVDAKETTFVQKVVEKLYLSQDEAILSLAESIHEKFTLSLSAPASKVAQKRQRLKQISLLKKESLSKLLDYIDYADADEMKLARLAVFEFVTLEHMAEARVQMLYSTCPEEFVSLSAHCHKKEPQSTKKVAAILLAFLTAYSPDCSVSTSKHIYTFLINILLSLDCGNCKRENELISCLIQLRKRVDGYLSPPEERVKRGTLDLFMVKLCMGTDLAVDYVFIILTMKRLFLRDLTLEEKRPDVCSILANLICQAGVVRGGLQHRQTVFQSIVEMVEHFQEHLLHKVDPIFLIANLIVFPEQNFTRMAGDLAQRHLKNANLAKLPKKQSPEWVEQQRIYKALVQRLIDTHRADLAAMAEAIVNSPFFSDDFRLSFSPEFEASSAIRKIISNPLIGVLSKGICQFLAKIEAEHFGLPQQAPNRDWEMTHLGKWLLEKKKEISPQRVTVEALCVASILVRLEYLLTSLAQSKPLSPEPLQAFIADCIKSLNSNNYSDTPFVFHEDPKYGFVGPLVFLSKFLRLEITSAAFERVLTCYLWGNIEYLIQTAKGRPAIIVQLIEEFSYSPALQSQDHPIFHNLLSRRLVELADKHSLFTGMREKRIKLVAYIDCEIDIPNIYDPADYHQAVRGAIDIRLSQGNSFSIHMAKAIIDGSVEAKLAYNPVQVILWHQKLLEKLHERDDLESKDLVLLLNLCKRNQACILPYLKNHTLDPQLTKVCASTWILQCEVLLKASKIKLPEQASIHQMGLDSLQEALFIGCYTGKDYELAVAKLNQNLASLTTA